MLIKLNQIIPNSAKTAFWISFLLCFLGGLFIILVLAPLTGISNSFGPGHDGYIQIAENLGRGNGYVFEEGGPPVFHRPPFYPYLLVPITLLPDFLQRPVLVFIQSLMVGGIGCILFEIARYFFGLHTAKNAIVIFLLNPWIYWNAKNPMTPITQCFLYILFLILVGREFLIVFGRYREQVGKTKSRAKILMMGIIAAALTLTHGAMLLVSGVSLFVLFIIGLIRRNYKVIKLSVISIIIMLALVAPWTYRNWTVFHRFIPVVRNGGLAYFAGNAHWKISSENPQRKESYVDASFRTAGVEATEAIHAHWGGLKNIELDDKMNQKMIEHLRTHPDIFVIKVLLNAIEYYFPIFTQPFLSGTEQSIKKSPEQMAITIFNLTLWILAIIAIWRIRKQRLSLLPVALMLVAIILFAIWYFPFLTFVGHSLYTFGTIPFLTILAARGLISHYKC